MDKNKLLFEFFTGEKEFPDEQERHDIAISQQIDLKQELYEVCNPDEGDDELTQEDIDEMSPMELLNRRLQWEGICGYTEDIVKWVFQAFGAGLDETELESMGL